MAENTGADRQVGAALTASDADGDTLTYSLEGTDAASFDIVPTSGQIKTKTGVSYNYEAKNSHAVTVKADDGHGGTDTIAVTINLTDLDEQPAQPEQPTVLATSGSATSLTATWTKPDLRGGPDITGYNVEYRQDTSGSWEDFTHGGTAVTATITGLTASKFYQVRVQAKNGETASEWSAPSDAVSTGPGGNRRGGQPVARRAASEPLSTPNAPLADRIRDMIEPVALTCRGVRRARGDERSRAFRPQSAGFGCAE